MHKYILKRLLALIPVILGVMIIVFLMISLTPGDPVLVTNPDADEETREMIREEMGLNDPLLLQFGNYLLDFVRGDMGSSYINNKPVLSEYFAKFPNTIKLAFVSLFIAIAIALPIGILCAVKQDSILDKVMRVVGLLGAAMPNFWQGLLFIMLFSLTLSWLPSGGADDGWRSMVLPALTLGTSQAALILRTTRSAMLEVVRQDYIRTARAKGVKERVVILKHAFKNALIPIVTVIGIQLGVTLGGAVVVETVFNWPGVGRLIIDSLNNKDRPMVMGCIILTTIAISILNLLVDIIYAYVDPRIKAQYKKAR